MRNYKLKTCRRCGKEFKPTGSNQIYCKECGDIIHKEEKKKYMRQYRVLHKEEIKEHVKQYHKQWYVLHREEIKKRVKQYSQTHNGREVCKRANKKYSQTPAGKKVFKKHNAKRRILDFNSLNDYFKGSEAHHINTKDVIYIPEEMHHSIYHNLNTRQGMAKINNLAIRFLLKQKEA